MTLIDKNGHGILFIVDDNDVLIGCLTDGDIRRLLIRTGNLSAKVIEAMNRKPKRILATERKKAVSYMKEKQITK